MAETVNKMWLKDKNDTKIAPSTTIDQVLTSDGSRRWINEYNTSERRTKFQSQAQ